MKALSLAPESLCLMLLGARLPGGILGVCGEGGDSALTRIFLPQGYLPANMERRKLTLQRKREEYFGFIQQYYDSRNEEHHQDTYRQVQARCPFPDFLPWYLPFLPLAAACPCSWGHAGTSSCSY